MREVTFKEFAAVAKKRGLRVESLSCLRESRTCKRRMKYKQENKHELPYIGILTDKPERVLQAVDFIDAKPGQKRCMATLVLIIDLRRDKQA